MKLTINKKAFSAALVFIDKIVETRNTVPILSNVLLDAGEGLTIIGTDMDLEMRMHVPANVEITGSTTVPASLIARLARSMPGNTDGDLCLELSENGNELKLTAARSNYDLPALPSVDFPDMQGPGESGHAFELPGAELAKLLKQVAYAQSDEEARFFLNGIYLHPKKNGKKTDLVAVATDGVQFCRATMPAPKGVNTDMPGIIIPRKTVSHITTICAAAEAAVAVLIDDKKIEISTGGTCITSRLVDGTFPEYERVIPTENSIEVDMDVETLNDIANRLQLLSDSKTGKSTAFELTDGQITISASGSDTLGAGAEELDVDYAGDPCSILLGIRQFANTIGACDEGLVTLCLKDNATPAILRPRGTCDAQNVTMLIHPRSF